MIKPRILLVEGKRTDHPSFSAGLVKKGYAVESASSGADAVAHLGETSPDLLVVDASSLRSSGKRICQTLHEKAPLLPIILVINHDGDPNDDYGVNSILILPFTLQKLVNRIHRLLPIQNNGGITAGPFTLDTNQRRLLFNDKQVQLTPKLVTLMHILLEHPGEVVERDVLFREAWQTDYTLDTRSLDVHMSWLRQAIEENPHKPRYIRTMRGVGYRLDVEPVNKIQKKTR